MASDELPEFLNPIKWLIGKWEAVRCKGTDLTTQPFTLSQELIFSTIGCRLNAGQPYLSYRSYSINPENQTPLHLESGFLRIYPGTNLVSLMLAHSVGITSLEEGVYSSCGSEHVVRVKSISIGKIMDGMGTGMGPEILELTRSYILKEDSKMEYKLLLKTRISEPHKQIKVIYKKMEQ